MVLPGASSVGAVGCAGLFVALALACRSSADGSEGLGPTSRPRNFFLLGALHSIHSQPGLTQSSMGGSWQVLWKAAGHWVQKIMSSPGEVHTQHSSSTGPWISSSDSSYSGTPSACAQTLGLICGDGAGLQVLHCHSGSGCSSSAGLRQLQWYKCLQETHCDSPPAPLRRHTRHFCAVDGSDGVPPGPMTLTRA